MYRFFIVMRKINLLIVTAILIATVNLYSQDETRSVSVGLPIRQDSLTQLESETQRSVDEYIREQDSVYRKQKELDIPARTRLLASLQYSENEWNYRIDITKGKPWNLAMKNLQMPAHVWDPNPIDIVHRELSKQEAFYVPFVNTYNPYGLKIPLDAISTFFGLTEDTSPLITYTLEYTSEVKIVVFSVQATAVATIFESVQQAGRYSITWNGRDDKGKPLPPGDYIAEIRIGNERYRIKRIELK